jgi:pSer/pThr/pTyr-binding forkhead associated (FHA) protein
MVRGRFEGLAQPADTEDEPIGQYSLRFGAREVPLDEGETLIGRGEGCLVVVNEAMVSRKHARVVLSGPHLHIEDLGSANGTYVNRDRVQGRQDLFAGDRIFIGTCEIEVMREAGVGRPTIPAFEDTLDRPTPSSGVTAYDPQSAGRVTQRKGRAAEPSEAEARAELEVFESTAHLADKMFTMGRAEAAVRILAPSLEEIRDAARLGRIPGPLLLDALGRYAVKLAGDTLDGRWVDLAIETHLLAVRPLREETIQKLAALRARELLGSDTLIAEYYEQLRGSMSTFTTADRILCERVACLLPALGLTP